jgi:nucleoside-diphosphate-sugar epimerase
MQELSADCDAILHLATAIPAKARMADSDWHLNDRIRREGTASLIAASLDNRCKLYVQQSVTFLYGDRNGDWVDETSSIAQEQPAMLQSAADMERLVLNAATHQRLPAVILRFGSFYAHDSVQTASMFAGIARRRFPVIGTGHAYWNMIHLDDAADAVVKTVLNADSRSGMILNICDDEPAQYRDVANVIADSLKVSRPRRIPAFVAKWSLGTELVRVLLSSVRCKNHKAKTEIGWDPRYPSILEGIPAEIAKWSKIS